MTAERAIEILYTMGGPDFKGHTEDILEARKLGIEALKVIKAVRPYSNTNRSYYLPGETPE